MYVGRFPWHPSHTENSDYIFKSGEWGDELYSLLSIEEHGSPRSRQDFIHKEVFLSKK